MPPDQTDDLLRTHAERLKRIAAKRKRGQKLSQAELETIGWQPEGKAQLSYDSIAAAAAGLNLDKTILQKAKRDGAPGFRGSRVYPLELLPWLNTQHATRNTQHASPDDKDTLERQLLKIEIQRRQFRLDTEQGKFIPTTDAAQWSSEMVAEFVKVLDAIPSSLAPDLAGCASVPELELRIRNALEGAKRMLHEGEWGKGEKAKG